MNLSANREPRAYLRMMRRQRYLESCWRMEKAEIERLRAALKQLLAMPLPLEAHKIVNDLLKE